LLLVDALDQDQKVVLVGAGCLAGGNLPHFLQGPLHVLGCWSRRLPEVGESGGSGGRDLAEALVSLFVGAGQAGERVHGQE
jgi:hypothetical protein